MQRRRHRNGIAVETEIARCGDRHLDVTEPEAGCDRNRRQQVCGVEQADIELVTNVRPRYFAYQGDIEALGGGKTLVDGDDQGRGIDQRNEANAKLAGHFKSSEAVRIDWAISPIFFFSRIAVDRSRT